MTATHVCVVLGTRPEIIKLSPVIRLCEQRQTELTLVHTGQHYSQELDDVFFEQLNLPTPDYDIAVGSGSHGQQTGEMLAEVEAIVSDEQPDVVVVQGDTNSVLAGAIATSKLDAELAHVEAGLRSFDREMPEEINRVLTDHVSDYLFAPTETARTYAESEGIDGDRVHVTGNTIVDAVQENRAVAEETSDVLGDHDLVAGSYVLLTAHRAENVDDPARFENILTGVSEAADRLEHPVVYPVHPRARAEIDANDIPVPENVSLVEPLDFLDFLRLESEATVIVTDSGGVQEEACILRTPCVTVRDTTERPETVEVGANEVVGTGPSDIVDAVESAAASDREWENPFGDGHASERILDVLTDPTAA